MDSILNKADGGREAAPAVQAQPVPAEAVWERVLDCGAPGPVREAPVLFYQDQPPAGQAEPPQARKSGDVE